MKLFIFFILLCLINCADSIILEEKITIKGTGNYSISLINGSQKINLELNNGTYSISYNNTILEIGKNN